jgi:hypothetical protein
MARLPTRTSTGRKKIQIRRIENHEARQVCFSKRRPGLFKKASELGIMCGAEVAAVAFSPAGRKPFTFGHPSVESVLERFIPSNCPVTQAAVAAVPCASDLKQALAELKQKHGELRTRLEEAKARNKTAYEVVAKAVAEGCQVTAWLNAYICQMGEEDLVAFAAVLANVQAAVAARAHHVLQEAIVTRFMVHGGGGGFEIGGTSGGMHTEHQLYLLMAPPPPPPGFAAGMEMMPQGFGPHGFPQ